ncbi:polynucleotide kinase-phosphatase [Pseudobacteroides cellulosolvens]|uniref:Polynucleotide kinase-phosphatase, bacterial n=1 Tax=Pseudobacteroides cellulosolvens ATCC 35603 = DSM 2933 TaxID=398512 RepID=A0A0L6JHK8_9FIRM|nr:polynucleotide kinase-phosphatase [Pseudobacteroides cellulosolvens]KNY25194.1 Polynucleotide kinase-phosphatase, bacterial [Pseudobacteroides cellulosolvens ATCC 35603 = DSM 2933]
MKLTVPELSLIVLVGASGSGKSTFAAKHFKATEVISSDFCRGLVSDDENDQSVTDTAFEVLHHIASQRLKLGKMTVVDATNVQGSARKPLVKLARDYNCLPVAIVFNMPEKVCLDRDKNRGDRQVGEHVIRRHSMQLRKSIRGLQKEGFRYVYVLNSPEEVEEVVFERQPLWNNLKHEHGPFDIVGDIHGCYDELKLLLEKLGYTNVDAHEKGLFNKDYGLMHPDNRKIVFLGDLVDRGPRVVDVLKLVMGAIKSGKALCVPGNHDIKLLKKLKGGNVQITHGLDKTLEQLQKEPPEFIEEVKKFIDGLVSHYVLDDGKLVAAHAGMKEEFQGRGSGRVREFALYGETTGETDEYGLPVRYDWASDYRAKATVVYGHTPQVEAQMINNTINIDTGCVFGGKLTAFRYPERELVEVKALNAYYECPKPFLKEGEDAKEFQPERDDVLDINDVLGKKIIGTRLYGNVTIQDENSIAALEVMSRFAADPHWLIYLPPTMSPSETSSQEGILEHPYESFEYFKTRGVAKVVCEQKHMGSRAVFVVCKDNEAAVKRFGVTDGTSGICYTRTGRHFFEDMELESSLVDRIRKALDKSGFWNDFDTDWVCLDCELMPWSAKAQALLKDQYSAVGISGRVSLNEAVKLLEEAVMNKNISFDVDKQTSGQNADLNVLLNRFKERNEYLHRYVDAYRVYCWNVESINDLRLAPFHILATEGKVHSDKDHLWHMENIKKYCASEDKLIMATNNIVVDVTDSDSIAMGAKWWEDLTASGGEGMVVKPFEFISKNGRELLQPAVKCRGKEYLRIIYGPEYTLKENIERLKKRSLGKKRSLALREFALGMEALERFVKNEPLYRVHECVFGVLALESEPVDPRL